MISRLGHTDALDEDFFIDILSREQQRPIVRAGDHAREQSAHQTTREPQARALASRG